MKKSFQEKRHYLGQKKKYIHFVIIFLTTIVTQFGFLNCSRNYAIDGVLHEEIPVIVASIDPCKDPTSQCSGPVGNMAPVAKDALIEPEQNKLFLVSLSDFAAVDIEGDPLTMSLLDSNGNTITHLEDRWTQINHRPDEEKLEVNSHLIGAATYRVRISDGYNHIDLNMTITPKNPLLKFKPALAVNNSQCLMCHAQINGNYVTSMGTDATKNEVSFWANDNDTKRRAGDYVYGNYTSYLSKSFFMTTYIKGKVFVPHKSLSASAQTRAQSIISEALVPQVLIGNTNGIKLLDFSKFGDELMAMMLAPTTGAQYYFALTKSRTSEYLAKLKEWAGLQKNLVPDTKIEEVASVSISAPGESVINGKVNEGELFTYYPQGPTSADLANFGKRPLRKSLEGVSPSVLLGNDPAQIMVCDGDLFVRGPVLLKDLRLKTKLGCRIHASGVVVLSGALASGDDGNLKRAYELIEPTELSALQLVSSRAVLMGTGYVNPAIGGHATIANAIRRLQHPGYPLVPGTLEDVKLMVGDTAEDSLILDVGTDPKDPEKSYGNSKSALRKV